jgi:hypothetical protein
MLTTDGREEDVRGVSELGLEGEIGGVVSLRLCPQLRDNMIELLCAVRQCKCW